MSEIDVPQIFETLSSISKLKDQFLKQRKVFLWGVVNDKTAEEITDRLIFLEQEDPGKEIQFFINSPGGSVTSGMVIYDTMQMISAPVTTICMGLAASMGSILLSGGAKGKRLIYPSGRVMIHQPHIGQLYGQAADIQIHAREIGRTKQLAAQIIAENCNQTVDKVLKDFDRDFWMNAEESLAYGIVDQTMRKL